MTTLPAPPAPLAALAVMRASLEDAHVVEILQRPGWTVHRLVAALADAGWTITRAEDDTAPQQAA